MKVEIKPGDGFQEVLIEGRLDSNTSSDLEKVIIDLINTGAEDILINFADVNYISSSGLRIFLVAAKMFDAKGKKIKFTNMQDFIKEVFDIAGFSVLFDFV